MRSVIKHVLVFFLASLLIGKCALGQSINDMLAKARRYVNDDPKKGIQLAQSVYSLAVKKNLKKEEIESLGVLSILSWSNHNNTEAEKYVRKGLSLAKRQGVDSLIGNNFVTYGLIYYSTGQYEKSIAMYDSANIYFNKNKLWRKLAITYMNIGIGQKKLSRFKLANASYFKALGLFELLKDSINICGLYNSIGNCFSSLKNFNNAALYYKRALFVSSKLNDADLKAQCLNNLGYANYVLNKPDSAIFYLNKCLQIRSKQPDSSLLVLPLQNLGSAWRRLGNAEKAGAFFKRSVKLAEAFSMGDEAARGYIDLGEFYLWTKNFNLAEEAMNTGEKIAMDVNTPELLEQIYALKRRLYESTGLFEKALFFEKKRNLISDSLFNIEQSKTIAELDVKYKISQKDKDIATLNAQNRLEKKIRDQQKQYIFILLVGLLAISMLLLAVYRGFRQKKKDNIHIQYLMHELHHRVRNNLQILSGIFTLQIAESPDEGHKIAIRENELRLNAMNLIYRKLYLDDNHSRIDIKEYLEQLIHHIQLALGADKRGIKLKVNIETHTIAADKALSLALIINELITNAIKYASFTSDGLITVLLYRNAESIFCLSVTDNGSSIAVSANNKTGGFGTRLLSIMVEQLNADYLLDKSNGFKHTLLIPDLEN